MGSNSILVISPFLRFNVPQFGSGQTNSCGGTLCPLQIPLGSFRLTANPRESASKWIRLVARVNYAYIAAMVHDERKPAGVGGHRRGCGFAGLLSGLFEMPMPGKGRHF